ncbi:wd40 repeat-containing protein smu1 [Anaeramoeba flamelloides]|uniref:Wd40 repeat-containing protein smu1 n=1 Tax=Anaeramoeba flamelloides TaxID=1746091 RepID=A0ABQ8YF30_9EUKA|nr:wd40 repeat-containing protein smu1 [Anaeramoeba flamelloides]
MNVEKNDLIQIVLQFLQENELYETKQILQKECKISLNIVPSQETLLLGIEEGKWGEVLTLLEGVTLPLKLYFDLHEEIIVELLILQEKEIATELFKTKLLGDKKTQFNEKIQRRIKRMKKMFTKEQLKPEKYFTDGLDPQQRRKNLSYHVRRATQDAKPSRLLTLIQQGIRSQKQAGEIEKLKGKYDLYSGSFGSEELVTHSDLSNFEVAIRHTIKFNEDIPTCISFSACGKYLLSGSMNGYLEVWNPSTGKLDLSLKYQKNNVLMTHQARVSALCFNDDSSFFVSCTDTGEIKFWHLLTGKCLKMIQLASEKAISNVCFTKDQKKIVVSTNEGKLLCYGLTSGTKIKEFHSHDSFINSFCFTYNYKTIISCGADSRIKLSKTKSAREKGNFRIPQEKLKYNERTKSMEIIPDNDGKFDNNNNDDDEEEDGIDYNNNERGKHNKEQKGLLVSKNLDFQENTINNVIHLINYKKTILVCNRSPVIYLMSFDGEILFKFYSPRMNLKSCNFLMCAISSDQEHIYAIDEHNYLFYINLNKKTIEQKIKLHKKEILDLQINPINNNIVTCSEDSFIKIWKMSDK